MPTKDFAAAVVPRAFSPATLFGKEPPPRQWIVRDWLPCGVVTGLYGDGGLGKSLIAQQLQTAMALREAWLGMPVEAGASLGVYCEDALDELWRRQVDVNVAYGVDFDALGDVHWISRLGEDNLLVVFGRNGAGELTTFHKQILAEALDLKARLVVIDTAADAFGGNENDRNQVRQFISRALGSIALRIKGAVLLCAHPSRAGLVSEEGDGGSTGWSNALRSRLYLRTPKKTEEEFDLDARILQRRKANYAARNDELRLRWRNGVIEPEPAESPGATALGKLAAGDVFLNLLRQFDEQGRPVSVNPQSGNYAARTFGRLPSKQRYDYREPDFRRAMEQLLIDGKIENAPYGRKGDERRKIAITAAMSCGGSRRSGCGSCGGPWKPAEFLAAAVLRRFAVVSPIPPMRHRRALGAR
jgi:RecA-family ATPase